MRWPWSSAEASEAIVVEEPVDFDRTIGSNWMAVVHLKPLPSKTQLSISIPLMNDTDDTLTVKKGTTDCGCADAVLQDTIWRPRQLNTLQLKIQSPDKLLRSRFQSNIVFDAASTGVLHSKLQIQIRVEFLVEGLLNFTSNTYPLRLSGNDEEEFTIPFICTIPNPKIRIDFGGSPIFIDARADTSESESKLMLTIAEKLIDDSGQIGKVTIYDESTGMSDEASVLVDRPRAIIVGPRTLRCVSKDGVYEAEAILRLSRLLTGPGEQSQGNDVQLSDPFIEALVNEKVAELTVQKLGDYVFKVKVRFPEPKPQAGEKDMPSMPMIKWRVVRGKKEFLTTSPTIEVLNSVSNGSD